MVHNTRYTLTSLAKAVQMNIATRFISIANMDVSHARRRATFLCDVQERAF